MPKALILADNQIVGRSTAFQLDSIGYESCHAVTRMDLEDALRRNRFDVVILQSMAPIHRYGDPLQLFRVIQQLHSGPTVIVGFDAAILKPVLSKSGLYPFAIIRRAGLHLRAYVKDIVLGHAPPRFCCGRRDGVWISCDAIF